MTFTAFTHQQHTTANTTSSNHQHHKTRDPPIVSESVTGLLPDLVFYQTVSKQKQTAIEYICMIHEALAPMITWQSLSSKECSSSYMPNLASVPGQHLMISSPITCPLDNKEPKNQRKPQGGLKFARKVPLTSYLDLETPAPMTPGSFSSPTL